MPAEAVQEVLNRLEGVVQSGDFWTAWCPAHDDNRTGGQRSLSIREGEDGRVLLKCFKGCRADDIAHALGLEMGELFPRPVRSRSRNNGKTQTAYHLRDENGTLVAIHYRVDEPPAKGESKGKKKVWWRGPNGEKTLREINLKVEELPLYGIEAVAHLEDQHPVVVVEGEKASVALTHNGIPAVGIVTGASSTPAKRVLEKLKDRPVVLWPDNDDEGDSHMRRVGKLLHRICPEVRWFDWQDAPDRGDAADHPDLRELNPDTLYEQLLNAPVWNPPHDIAMDGAASMVYVDQPYAVLRQRRREGGGITGIKTGLARLDQLSGGLNKGEYHLVASRPNQGKSLLIGQGVLSAALQGYRALLQTPEMSAIQFLDRMACYVADVDFFKARTGQTSDKEERKIQWAVELIGKLPLFVDDYGTQTVQRIRDNIDRLEPDLLAFDYIQYLEPDDPKANRNQQVGQLSRSMSRLKSDFDIALLGAAQLNRASESRPDKAPDLGDLRDSGELEQDADLVHLLHQPNRTDPNEADVLRIFTAKHRNGMLMWGDFYFVPGQNWITDTEGSNGREFL